MASNLSHSFHISRLVLGNVPLSQGVRRFLYAVHPREASFPETKDVPKYLDEAMPFFLGAIAVEFVVALLRGIPTIRLNDSFSSLSAGTISQLSKMVVLSIQLVTYTFVYNNFHLVSLPWDSPWTWYLCFLGVDFGYYWFHRAAHEINIMWAAHQVHHSSEEYNLTTALRQSVVQNFTSWGFYLPMALGIPPSIFLVHIQFTLLYQFWIHTEVVQSLGPLEYIFNTPSHHRVHHGRNPYCIDKNYGGTLIIWDRLFGTFQPETEEKVAYGLVHPLASWNPIYTQTCHFTYIFKTFWETPGLQNKLSVLFKGPGWYPGTPRLGDPADIPEVENPVTKYDVSLPFWENIYAILHTVVVFLAYQLVVAKQMVLSQLNVWGVVLYLIFALTSVGALFDKKWYASFMELTRCLLFLLIDLLLTSHNMDTGVLPTPIVGVVRLFFIGSVFLWIMILAFGSKSKEKAQ